MSRTVERFHSSGEQCKSGTTNHSAKTLTFVNANTTRLYGCEITAVENECMLLLLTFTSDVFLCREK